MSVIDTADDTAVARATGAVRSPAEQLTDVAARVGAALMEAQRTGSREAWLAVTAHCQHLVNSTTAVQDAAIAEVARRESVWCEDGTLGEMVHVPGRVTLDAADLVAPVIGATHPQAQRRVEQAVRLAARRVPVPAEARDLPDASGLGGLHQAMAAGHLDSYRAAVIAFELEVAPADVADAVVAALTGHLSEDSTSLRRRTRVLLSRISPDLVRERAQKARNNTGLRRWVAEPGIDQWHGTFPSEDAATAWAAIDRLAHDLVAAGTCSNIEQARGKALTDLVTGHATVDVQIMLTVPAGTQPASEAGEATATVDAAQGAQPQSTPHAGHCEPDTGSAQPASAEADGRQAHTRATKEAPEDASVEGVPAHAPPLTAGDDDDLIEVQGSRPSEPLLVRRSWLRDHLRKRPPQPRRGRPKTAPAVVPCAPLTGARLDPRGNLTTDAYRPNAELTALVKARDGRCRFPGCCVAARFCDLDHVRPWPIGRTTARNLLTLCLRHHRIKQRPGWRLHLAPDGTATWTDPTGRVRTTTPLNALHTLVLVADAVLDPPATRAATPSASDVLTAWSALETHLEFALDHQTPGLHLTHPAGHIVLELAAPTAHRRCSSATRFREARRRARRTFPDEPPF